MKHKPHLSEIRYRIRKTHGLPKRQQKKERNIYRQQKCKSRLRNCVKRGEQY